MCSAFYGEKISSKPLRKVLSGLENISGSYQAWILLYMLLIVLIFLRKPDSLLNAQPWAEDGKIFLQQAIADPYGSIFTSYAGYLHLLPRIVTLISLQFGLANAPFIMNFAALMVSAICILYIFSSDFRFLVRNDLFRFFTAILIACIPTAQIWMNITNIQWFLLLFVTLWTTNLLFNKNAFDRKIDLLNIGHLLLLAIAFLSCPLSFMFLPGIAIGLALRVGEKKALTGQMILSILPVLCMILHIAVCMLRPDAPRVAVAPVINAFRYLSGEVVSWFAFVGSSGDLTKIGYTPLFFATLIIISLLVFIAIKRGDCIINAWLLAIAAIYVAVLLFQRPDYLSNFSSDTVFRGIMGGRFLLLPVALILIMIVRDIDIWQYSKKNNPGILNYVPIILLLIFSINVIMDYEQHPFTDFQFKQYASLYDPDGNQTCIVPINPAGWNMTIPCKPPDHTGKPV